MKNKFKKGQKVLSKFYLAGVVSEETFTVLKVDKKGVWLDNGLGNRPTGPFDPITGEKLEMFMGRQVIEPVIEKVNTKSIKKKASSIQERAFDWAETMPKSKSPSCNLLAEGYVKGSEDERKITFKFFKWIDDEEIPYKNGTWKYFDGKENYFTTKQLFKIFLNR